MAATQAVFTLLFLSALCLSPCRHLHLLLRGRNPICQRRRAFAKQVNNLCSATSTDRDVLVQDLLKSARSVGQVGSLASTQDQEMLIQKAKKLVNLSDPNPAQVSLRGSARLGVFCSSRRFFWKTGRTTVWQSTTNVFRTMESLSIASSLGLSKSHYKLQCENKSATVNAVKFETTTISLFGNTLVTKELNWRWSLEVSLFGRGPRCRWQTKTSASHGNAQSLHY